MTDQSTHTSLALVVHGIGEQKRGSDLQVIVEGFLPLIRHRIDEEVELSVKPLDDNGPATVSFDFQKPYSSADVDPPPGFYEKHTLKFTEVWWAASFGAPGLGALLMGAIEALKRKFSERGRYKLSPFSFLRMAIWTVVWRLISNVVLIAFGGVLMFPALLLAIGGAIDTFIRKLRNKPPVPQPTMLGALQEQMLEFIARGQTLIVETAIILASPLLALALVLLGLIELVPPNILNKQVTEIHRSIVNLLTRHFGDMWSYLYVPWEASRVRMRFEDQFRQLCKDLDGGPAGQVASVMVIAHSMGSVVAYEGLSGPHLRGLIEQHFGASGQPRLYYLSIGSALNLAWDVVPNAETHRLDRALPACIDWLNLWTDYDPVPGGQLRPAHHTWAGRNSSLQPGMTLPHVQREVVNQMDMFSDHSAYWNNAEQVVAPMLDMLTNQVFKQRLQMDVSSRRHRVRILSALKGFAWMAGPVSFFIVLLGPAEIWDSLGVVGDALGWLLSLLAFVPDVVVWAARGIADGFTWLVGQILGDGVETKVKNGWDSFWDFQRSLAKPHGKPLRALGWAAEVAVVAILVYSSVVKWAWDSWDQASKYKEPRPMAAEPTVRSAATAASSVAAPRP